MDFAHIALPTARVGVACAWLLARGPCGHRRGRAAGDGGASSGTSTADGCTPTPGVDCGGDGGGGGD